MTLAASSSSSISVYLPRSQPLDVPLTALRCVHTYACVCACDVGKDPDKHGMAEWTQLSQKAVVWELSVLAYL